MLKEGQEEQAKEEVTPVEVVTPQEPAAEEPHW